MNDIEKKFRDEIEVERLWVVTGHGQYVFSRCCWYPASWLSGSGTRLRPPVKLAQGGRVLTFTDISDLNKREQALEKARKDAGWSPPRQRPRRKINWPATVRIRIASINKSLRGTHNRIKGNPDR